MGLRLDSVTALGFESEVVEVRNRSARRETLQRGADQVEIRFLAPTRRSRRPRPMKCASRLDSLRALNITYRSAPPCVVRPDCVPAGHTRLRA